MKHSSKKDRSPKTNGQGSRASQGRPRTELSNTGSTPQARPCRSRPMKSNGEDDGNDENSRKPLKHSHDESDDCDSAGEERKRQYQTQQGIGSGKTDQCSNRSVDGVQQEAPSIDDSTPTIYDIASARIPDHLLNNAAFTNPPRYQNRPRGHSTATSSARDVYIQLVERRNSVRDDRFQGIPQTVGAADDISLADEIMTADIVPLSHTAREATSGVLSEPLLDQPGYALAGQSHDSAARMISRSIRPTAMTQTDGPGDDGSLTDEQMARSWSWDSGDDKALLSTNTAAESLSLEKRTGNALGGRTFPSNLSLPIRSRSAAPAYFYTHSSAPSSSWPNLCNSTRDSGVSRYPTSPTQPSSSRRLLGTPPDTLSLGCARHEGNCEAASKATVVSEGTPTLPSPSTSEAMVTDLEMVSALDGHESPPEKPSPKMERTSSVSSDSDSMDWVSEAPGIPLANLGGRTENVGSVDVGRSRQGSASSTSTCGYCGCGIVDALLSFSCCWFQRRNSQSQAAEAVPDAPDGPPAPPVMPQAPQIVLDLPDPCIVLDMPDGPSTASSQAQAPAPAPAARNDATISSAPPQDSSSADQASRRRVNRPMRQLFPGMEFGLVYRTEEQVRAQGGWSGQGGPMPNVGWNLALRPIGERAAANRRDSPAGS